MKNKFSLVTCAAILSISSAYADSSSFSEALKNGTTSGDISAYTVKNSKKSPNKNEGFSSASVGLNYESDSINGFSIQTAFRANHKLSEIEDNDYKNAYSDKTSLTLANIQYSNDLIKIIAGKQEVDLEWAADNHDAISAVITPNDNTTLTALWTNRKAEIGIDVHEEFTQVNPNNGGAYALDAKFSGIKDLELNTYYYTANKIANYYGVKASYENDMLALMANYATSNEDLANKKDGSILVLEASTSINDLSLSVGYITTDKKGGSGSINSLGENTDPSEELGDYIFEVDAKTTYLKLAYDLKDFEISGTYTNVDSQNTTDSTKTDKSKELTLSAAYPINDALTVELLYSDIKLQDSSADFTKVAASLTYEF